MDILLFRTVAEGLSARLTGPGKGRFILQPLISIGLGIRDGIADARQNEPPFFVRVLFERGDKVFLLKHSLKNIAMPLTLGVVLDLALQWVIFQAVRLYPAIGAGTLLVALPYSVARGLLIALPAPGLIANVRALRPSVPQPESRWFQKSPPI